LYNSSKVHFCLMSVLNIRTAAVSKIVIGLRQKDEHLNEYNFVDRVFLFCFLVDKSDK
jgi:hypothetical protein